MTAAWPFGELTPLSYDLLLIDPATRFETRSVAGEAKSPQAQYATMTWDELALLPNEAAAFVIWNESTRAFSIDFPIIDDATPSRLVYRTPALAPDWHVVCDVHSHGAGPAFFSGTDNIDDSHATKISLVVGRLGRSDGPAMVSRLCAAGMFLPLPRSPFSGDHDAA